MLSVRIYKMLSKKVVSIQIPTNMKYTISHVELHDVMEATRTARKHWKVGRGLLS